MKGFFKSIFLFFMINLSVINLTHANQTEVLAEKPELYQVNSLEDIEKDLTKRLILGTLGKDALIFFLPQETSDAIKDQVRNLSDAEVYRMSKPFNSSIISGVLIIVAAFFLVALMTMLLYVIWIYLESLFRTQDSGEFLGGRWNKIFTPLKIVSGFFLIVPMFGSSHAPFNSSSGSDSFTPGAFSLAQVMILHSAGVSSNAANIVYGEFVRSMPKNYPAIKMPNLYSKQTSMLSLIDFMICVKTTYGNSVNIDFGRYNGSDKSVYKTNVKVGSCEFYGQVGYDEATVSELENNNAMKELFGNVNYREMQKQVISTAVNNAFSRASKVADSIMVAQNSINLMNTKLPFNSSNWKDYCQNIENALPEDATENDIILYTYYAGNCLSQNFIEDLSKSSLSADYIYGNENYLNGNYIELCNHEVGNSKTEKNLTFAKFKEEEFVFAPNFKLIKSCVDKVCGGKNIYECASAIHFAKSVQDKEELAKQGWITAGGNFYKLFTGSDNIAAKSIINKSYFKTDYVEGNGAYKNILETNDKVIDKFSITINGTSKEDFDTGDYEDFMESKGNMYPEIVSEKAQTLSFSDGGRDGWFGIAKFQNCIESPMRISNGYLCGNITEELHLFGSKLIALGVQIKTITLFMYNTPQKADKGSGTVQKKTNAIVGNAFRVIDYAGPKIIAGYLLSESFNTGDSFSDSNPEIWQQYPEVISFIGMATVTNLIDNPSVSKVVLKIINIFMGLCIFLGIIFGFFMPLLPLGLWLIAVSGWIIALFEALVLCQIWGVVLISPSADHSSDAAKKSTIIVVSILLKAPLLIVGLILAWILNNILLSEILAFTDISQALSLQSGDIIKGIIDQFIMLIIYFIVLYGLYNIIFSLIESFEKVAISILFSGDSMSPFASKQRDSSWNNSLNVAAKTLTKG